MNPTGVPLLRLQALTNGDSFDLALGTALVVGRAPSCDIPIPDPTVSRRHAELRVSAAGVEVRDLGSSNNTLINGARIERAPLSVNDTITFGKVSFRLISPSAGSSVDLPPGGTVVRRIEVATDALSVAPAGLSAAVHAMHLSRLLDFAKRLSGEYDLDGLLRSVVDLTFDLVAVDRVALLLHDDRTGELVPTLAKSRLGDASATRVPRSIAERVVAERTPIITENAVEDERFQSGSVVLQNVRGAICTPLMASADRVLGVLYADTLTANRPFSDADATAMFAFGGLAAVAIGKIRYAEEVQRENAVRANFERFFAPDVARVIAASQGAVRPGGERREVTVLFNDIRGFTPLAETLPPEEIAAVLTEYFTEMVDVVFEYGGTVDKFIGDAIMAIWGAPLSAPDDTDRAVRAAIAMQAALTTLNARWVRAGHRTLSIGIGLNRGEVFAGKIGSERRLEYTVLGDAVNIASRLCSEAGPGEILITDSVLECLTIRPPVAPVDGLVLPGKTKAVRVFRVTDEAGGADGRT